MPPGMVISGIRAAATGGLGAIQDMLLLILLILEEPSGHFGADTQFFKQLMVVILFRVGCR